MGAPHGVGNERVSFRFFLLLGKGFSKLKVAEKALSISEQIIPSRLVLGLFPGGHPQSACLNI